VELLETIDDHLAGLTSALSALAPETASGADAAAVVERAVRIERLGAAARARFARRVTETGAYEESGHKHAAGWLAERSGESVGQALGVLKTAAQLSEAPLVDDAFKDGRLSLSQAKVAADAGALDPSSQQHLVDVATAGSLKDLKAEAARIKRKRFGEDWVRQREETVHRRRYCRIWSATEGGVRLDAWLPTVEGARVKAALDREADRVFKEARAAGVRDRADAYAADALVRVVTGEASPPAQVAVRVDAGALRRGHADGDEVCEIPGVGPIPIAVAKDLLGDSVFHVVVTDGIDIKAVTSPKRTIPAPLRRALVERDGKCAVPGCNATLRLQIDHCWDFGKDGPTMLANLQRLCPPHHSMKTHRGFRLVGPPGARRWVGPD
jgi:Domain of unknown function (DUF222)